MSRIFFHNPEQEQAALQSKAQREEELGLTIKTQIEPFTRFYLAEDYHQKYYLQSEQQLALEVKGYYSDFTGFINSTAAARLNGIVGGYGDPTLLAEEIDSLGLSAQAKELLQRFLR